MRLLKSPVLCNYYLTYRCNAACGFCDIWEKPSPYATPENVESNLRDLKKLGVRVIDFTGGEPLLHRQLGDFLSMAKKMGFITTVTTNCLLYPKMAEKLKGKIDMLHFSLDSPLEEEHNASRGVKCFDKVMESISIAKEMGERPDIIFTVTHGNIGRIKKVYEEFSKPNNLMLILNPVFEYNKVGEELGISELDFLSDWGRKKLVYLNEAFIQLRKDGGNNVKKPVCRAVSSTIVISPENKMVLPCYHLGLEEIPIRNNLLEIRKSKKIQELKKREGTMEGCSGCAINCYMQPSFAVEINKYFWKALPSTLKYSWEKKLFRF